MNARGDIQIGPNAVLRGAGAAPGAVTGAQPAFNEELRQERDRREQAENALLQAAEKLRLAEARLAELEPLTKDAALVKRKLDQAQADIRRLRGGQPLEERGGDDGEAPKLRARVAELEGELATARAAAAAASAASAALAATPMPAALPVAPAGDAEAAKLKRQVEQLQSELRRARGGQAPEPAPAPAPPPPVAAPAPARPDPEMADAAIALGDSLAELRSSLRAANDESGLLTAPTQSVQVVVEALRAASEELETARGHLRTLGKKLGVS
jgi:DNA repair exonuclease SbcCD ATPase subunit